MTVCPRHMARWGAAAAQRRSRASAAGEEASFSPWPAWRGPGNSRERRETANQFDTVASAGLRPHGRCK